MPAWLLAALGLLGGIVGGGGIPGITGQGIPLLPAALDPFEPGGIDIFAPGRGRGGDGKRRRRKRALTNSDRDDIAFIAATISKAAAGSFAVQLVTRSR